MKKILKQVKLVTLALTFSLSGFMGLLPAGRAAAACAALPNDKGNASTTISIPTNGTYRVWSRIMAPDTTNNSYLLQIDDTTCNVVVGDSASIPANTWTWVDYSGGNTATKTNVTLTAGSHMLSMAGREAGVKLDRIELVADTACVPTGIGDNCAAVAVSSPVSGVGTGGRTPYGGTAPVISGTTSTKIEAENYDQGGEGQGFHDVSTTGGCSASGASCDYRGDAVAVKNDVSYSNGHDVGYFDNGDWLSYTVSVAQSGTYTLRTHAATNVNDGTLNVSLDGSSKGTVTATNTNGFSTFADSPALTLPLTPGTHVIKLTAASPTSTYFGDLDYVSIAPSTSTTPNLTADINGDGHVNTLDLSVVLTHDNTNYAPADLNHDGTVGAADLAILLSHWVW
jgi:hypothetical protein